MRNKIINQLLVISNVFFIVGLLITTILINKMNLIAINTESMNQIILHYIPFIIFMILSLVSSLIFGFFRKEYFLLINPHLTKKSITLYKASVFMLFFNIFLAIVLIFSGLSLPISKIQKNIDFFQNGYIYIVLGVEMFLTFIDVLMDALSKLKVKVDLANKRMGFFEELNGDDNGK